MIETVGRKGPGRREDGAATRAQILEAAGEVFAEKGFDRATGKAIAERAGTNSAAVNYYFGGIEGLYAEVLVEAHHRLLAYESLAALADGPGTAAGKLRRVIELMVRTVAGPAATSWALRVLGKEILSPSPAFHVLRDREVLPKKRILTGLVAEILRLPPDHPTVARCCLNLVSPFLMLLVGDRRILEQIFPTMMREADPAEALAAHLVRYAFGGIAAVAEQEGLACELTARADAPPVDAPPVDA